MSRPTPEPCAYITINQAADITGCTTGTIRRRIEDKTLPAYRFGPRSIRIKREDLDLLFERVEEFTA